MANRTRPDNMSDMESLLEKNADIKYSERWHPTLVSFFESELKNGEFRGMSKEIRKNIAYSLQYLEYLQMQISEIHFHDVVLREVYKTYVITAMSIIEAIFFHLVKKSRYVRKKEWDEERIIQTNVYREDNIEKKISVVHLTKLPHPQELDMDFEYLINKVQEKELISLTGRAYPRLKELKRLRNKVHLQIVKHPNDTDYNKFSFYDYWLVRHLLYQILRDDKFEPDETEDSTCLSFLEISSEQNQKLDEYINSRRTEENQNG